MEQVRPLTSLSTDELIARIEQYVVVVELRDAEIRELHAANSALLAERDALRDALEIARDFVAGALAQERDAYRGHESVSSIADIERYLAQIDAALAQGQGGSDDIR